jgi:hypothetical protein
MPEHHSEKYSNYDLIIVCKLYFIIFGTFENPLLIDQDMNISKFSAKIKAQFTYSEHCYGKIL